MFAIAFKCARPSIKTESNKQTGYLNNTLDENNIQRSLVKFFRDY